MQLPLWALLLWILAVITMLIFLGLLYVQRIACPFIDLEADRCELVNPGYCRLDLWFRKEKCEYYLREIERKRRENNNRKK